MLNTPFSPWPNFSAEETEAVASVLLSNRVNYWTGKEGREFEKEFAAWAGYWRKQVRCSWSIRGSHFRKRFSETIRERREGTGGEMGDSRYSRTFSCPQSSKSCGKFPIVT